MNRSLHTERLELTGEWTADIVRESDLCRNDPRDPLIFPTAQQWNPVLANLLRAPETLDGYQTLKVGTRSRVLRASITCGSRKLTFVAKLARSNSWPRRLADTLRHCRARRSSDKALELLRADLQTPHPLAILESRSGHASWLITTYIDGLLDLDEIALRRWVTLAPADRPRVKRALIKTVADFLIRFHQRGFAHRDLKASNIMIRDWDGSGSSPSVWLLDLEGLRRSGARRRDQALARLAASLMEYDAVTHADHVRFLRTYLDGAGLDSSRWRERCRAIAVRVAGRNARSVRRKRGKLDGYVGTS